MKSYGHLAPAGVSRIRITECEESLPYEHEGQLVRTVAYAGCLYNNPIFIENGRIAVDRDGGLHFVPPNNKLSNGSRIDNIRTLNDSMKSELEGDFLRQYSLQRAKGPQKEEPAPAPVEIPFHKKRKSKRVSMVLSEDRWSEIENQMNAEGVDIHRKSFSRYIQEKLVGDKKKKS